MPPPVKGGLLSKRLFTEPNTYTFTYFRSDPSAYAQEFICDAQDPAMGETTREPDQR